MTGSPAAVPLTRTAWIALGSNVGNRRAALDILLAQVGREGFVIAAASPQIITHAVGITAQRDFLNQVIRVEASTPVTPHVWLQRCKAAETAAGRGETYRMGPRRADADILLLGERGEIRLTCQGLDVPHPRVGERPFLCALLASIDPSLRHPDGWSFASRSSPWGWPSPPAQACAPSLPGM